MELKIAGAQALLDDGLTDTPVHGIATVFHMVEPDRIKH